MTYNNLSLIEHIERWGHASSIALLDPRCLIFSTPGIEGIIGYRSHAQCMVVFGDPVCPQEALMPCMQAFHSFAQERVKSIVYAMASEKFTNWTLDQKICHSAISIGNEIILNPLCDIKTLTGNYARLLRNQCTYAVRQGMTVKEHNDGDPLIDQALEEVKQAWLANRKGPQAYFFSQINLFEHRENKRYFYVEYYQTIVGFIMLNRINSYQGWVLNIMMMLPDLPTSTSGFLVMSTLDALRQEQCAFVSIGTTPSATLDRIEGLNSMTAWMARHTYKVINNLFKLSERQRYWKKFHPTSSPTFIAVNRPKFGLREGIAIMRAFNVF